MKTNNLQMMILENENLRNDNSEQEAPVKTKYGKDNSAKTKKNMERITLKQYSSEQEQPES